MTAHLYGVETRTAMSQRVARPPRTVSKRSVDRNVEILRHATSPKVASVTEEDRLAVAFVARDQRALAEIYRMHAPTLYAVAVRVLGVRQDAEDCVHDTLLRIWLRPNTYRKERGTLGSLLVVAVRNDALSRRRSDARHYKIEQRARTPILEDDFTGGLRDHVECAKLRAALEALAPELREPIVRAYMLHQTHDQISKELNVPLGTIKSRLIIALRKLHGELTAEKQRA